MKINNTYIIEAAPGNEFVLDLLALAQKYNVSVKPASEVTRCLRSTQRISNDMPFLDQKDKETFIRMVQTNIKHHLSDCLLNDGLINFETEEIPRGTDIIGTITVMTI